MFYFRNRKRFFGIKKISLQKGIIEKKSYERRVYESGDDSRQS